MRTKPFGFALLIIVTMLTMGLMAGDAAPAKESSKDAPHLAVYKVPSLDNDMSKNLIKSLTKVDGVISAKPDTEGGVFSVTFEPKKTSPEKIQETMVQVAPGTELAKVGPADAKHSKKDCGKCPNKKSCSKKKG